VRNTATLFTRVLADLFPGKPANQPSTSTPAQAAAPAVPPAGFATNRDLVLSVIGQGAQNEKVITIGDTPHLFVDEGDHIVQFTPAFDDHTEETEFGMKIVPDLEPHWSQVMIHRCELKSAIATAIRQGNRAVANVVAEPTPETPSKTLHAPALAEDEPFEAGESGYVRRRRAQPADASSVTGRIVSWGEEKFPDRKREGRHYVSFAMHIETSSGERTLQGEGLKEAIAECRCVVGDVVSVRRTGKVKVPAIRQTDGTPIMKDGKPLMWDKWLWSISK
jgi:hypothetical protein